MFEIAQQLGLKFAYLTHYTFNSYTPVTQVMSPEVVGNSGDVNLT